MTCLHLTCSSNGRGLNQNSRGQGFESVKACIFSGFLKDASKTAMILNIFASLGKVHLI